MIYRYDNAVKQILSNYNAKACGIVQKGMYKKVNDSKIIKPEPWMHVAITGHKRTKDTHGAGSVTDYNAVIYIWDTRQVLSTLAFSVADAGDTLFAKCTKANDNRKPLVWPN